MQLRFSIRDLLWFTAVAALAAQTMKSSIALPPGVVVILALLLLKYLAASIGASRLGAETALQRHAQDYLNSSLRERSEVREQLVMVIEGLTLLETALTERDEAPARLPPL
jgi:hypothetical protein